MIPIENENKRIDWNALHAEYIGGGISQRKLAAKYGVSPDALMQKANREGWKKDRDKAVSKGIAKIQQKSAEKMADNATLAADLKQRLLMRISRIEQKYPFDATEIRTQEGKNTVTFRLRDLTAAYKDLTADMATSTGNNELLQSLYDMERRAGL